MYVAVKPPPEVGGFTATGDKSVDEFGETKYSQFAPETGSKAQVIEMRVMSVQPARTFSTYQQRSN